MTNKFQLLYCIVSEFPPVASAGYSTLWDHDWRRKLFVQPRREGKGTAGENRPQDVHAAKTFENSRLAAGYKGRVLPAARSQPGRWPLTAGCWPLTQAASGRAQGTPAGRGAPPGDTRPPEGLLLGTHGHLSPPPGKALTPPARGSPMG